VFPGHGATGGVFPGHHGVRSGHGLHRGRNH
jgi:hypothetical protein